MKYRSTFFTDENINKIRNNSMHSGIRDQILENVKRWAKMSRDDLWALIFGCELKRARCVFTDGYCPSCGQTVHMYGWLYDAFKEPWKVWCPHCGERFPKNDFEKYYTSGLDGHYEFSFELADRSLLYNEAAPDPDDPRHLFGVDDGRGYHQGKDRWLFAGHYILHGVWYKQICDGIKALSEAYLLTGDKEYALRCGIMLDRIADIFPRYDYYHQGYMYIIEDNLDRGYAAVWHDMIRQLHTFLLAYDAIFEAVKADPEFLSFVTGKSEKYKTPVRKKSFADIQSNIEDRIFGNAMANPWKIESNPPWPEMYKALTLMVLTEWPVRPEDMYYNVYCVMWWMPERILKKIVEESTMIDGLSGEKGFISYSSIAMIGTAELLTWISLYDEDIIGKMARLYPNLIEGIRFLINSWLLCSYYPGCGDTNTFNKTHGLSISPGYASWSSGGVISPGSLLFSYEGYLWRLYKITSDVNILRFMYNSDNYDTGKLFTTDLALEKNAKELQDEYISILEEKGTELEQQSMNAEKWKIAILHSGRGYNKRAAYLDYDSGGVHGHNDCMNIGLYAKGMNYLPDPGYPPTHRKGGFHSEFFYWYRSAASHNTAIVDGIEHRDYCWFQRDVNNGQGIYSETGKSVLWGSSSWVSAVAADNPEAGVCKRFERLLTMVDLSEDDCYFFDIFRIKGGSEHVKLTHGGFDCALKLSGIKLTPYEIKDDPFGTGFIRDRNAAVNIPYTFETGFKFVRNTRIDKNPRKDWRAVWEYRDRYGKWLDMPEGVYYSLQFNDLTDASSVISFDSFLDSFGMVNKCDPDSLKEKKGHPEIMRPAIAVMRRSDTMEELESTFIGIYDTYSDKKCSVISANRLSVKGIDDQNRGAAAFEVETAYGTDLILAGDVQDKKVIIQKDWDVSTDADLCILRKTRDGIRRLAMFNGSFFRSPGKDIELGSLINVYETDF